MGLWEFHLQFDDGSVVEQTVVAEGASEQAAAGSASSVIADLPGVALARPGVAAAPEVEARWREMLEQLPGVVSDSGRLARYARGVPQSS